MVSCGSMVQAGLLNKGCSVLCLASKTSAPTSICKVTPTCIAAIKGSKCALATQFFYVGREIRGVRQVVEEFIDAVIGDRWLDRRRAVECDLRIGTMHGGFVQHAARPKSRVLIRTPRPHLRIGIGGFEYLDELLAAFGEPIRERFGVVGDREAQFGSGDAFRC